MQTLDVSINNPLYNGVYGATIETASVFVLDASGGFSMERAFADIKLAEKADLSYVDVTDSVQILMSVDLFNSKLMVNGQEYDTQLDVFPNDEIEITADDLIAALEDDTKIISVGKYETLYSDFTTYVNDYFGTNGFETLFAAASEFEIDRVDASNVNIFNGAAFIQLLTAVAEDTEAGDGSYISELSGSIQITNITKLLRYALDTNAFGNRDPSGNDVGVAAGFVAGDLIWVPAGTTIVLRLDIDEESFAPLNNDGPNKAGPTKSTQDYLEAGDNFSTQTEASTTSIVRTVKAPLLIKLE